MNLRGQPDQSVQHPVRSNQNAVKVRILRDPLQFRQAADIFRVGADDIHSLSLDQILEVLAEVYLLAGVNRSGRAIGYLFEHLGVRVLRVIACDHVFKPRQVERLHCARKPDCILDCPARSAVQGEADFIPANFFHSFGTSDPMIKSTFCQHAVIGMRRSCPRFAVPAVWNSGHHVHSMKGDVLFDQRKALRGRLHLGHGLGEILGHVTLHGKAKATVVDADTVPELAAQ